MKGVNIVMILLRKFKTFVDYAHTGWCLGADLRSKWLLASMLFRLKLGFVGQKSQKLYKVDIQVGYLKSHLFIRPTDIFIIHEVFGEDPYIHSSMKNASLKSIVDLGAHIGLSALRFKAEFPDAEVYCYEPDPENFELLRLNTHSLTSVFVHREAVGSQRGEAVLYIPGGRHSASSLREPLNAEQVHKVPCQVKPLDEILSEIGHPVDLIKFDIKGLEYEIFAASKMVHEVHWIVGEIKGNRAYVDKVLELFPKHNSEVRWFAPNLAYLYLVHKFRGEA